MKKLIPLIVGMAIAFGAVTTYASNSKPQGATKATKNSKKKKST